VNSTNSSPADRAGTGPAAPSGSITAQIWPHAVDVPVIARIAAVSTQIVLALSR
jgi:hypothetical protein